MKKIVIVSILVIACIGGLFWATSGKSGLEGEYECQLESEPRARLILSHLCSFESEPPKH